MNLNSFFGLSSVLYVKMNGETNLLLELMVEKNFPKNYKMMKQRQQENMR
jgi:hypothetical protein